VASLLPGARLHRAPQGEATAVRACDVDLGRRRIDVHRAFSDVGGHVVLGTPKSHQSRTVPVPSFLARELAAVLDGRKPDDLVFTMPGGSRMRLSNWRRATFLPARARAGISDRFRIHDLRHTAASLMIQSGYPPKMLQAIMGHASITTTLDLYGHLYPGDMDRYADLLGEAAEAVDPAKSGQRIPAAAQTRAGQRDELGRVWRARRDSNPQPSDP
jgi:integrase